jgi:cytochrome c-type biogenesis protein CcmF
MTVVGQLCLLVAFASSGYASFAFIVAARSGRQTLRRIGAWAGSASVVALTVALTVLGYALYSKDFGFAYVAQYSSRLLPWHYSLSALWVGQAGSLLLWAWMLGVLSLVFRRQTNRRQVEAEGSERRRSSTGDGLGDYSFGLLMAYLCFLTATMVFAADPMEPSVAPSSDGQGLSPLLQHPAMLFHPPVVFLGYAGWAIPCALTLAGLAGAGLDRSWLLQVRPWAMFAWAVLGIGILLGAHWSYEELGWGGYWAWDPVENASLIPWLTGMAFLHALMAWRFRSALKKTAAALAVATFGLCNFATFLTRSGIFSSLHAFSRSPIGWLFLGMMSILGATTVLLILIRRSQLAPERPIAGLLSCEAMVSLLIIALVLLASLVTVGTLFMAVSEAIVGRRIMVGPEFYNNGLVATGLVAIAAMTLAPLLQWGSAPTRTRKKAIVLAAGLSCLAVGLLAASGSHRPLDLSLIWFAFCASIALVGRVFLDVQRRLPDHLWSRLSATLRSERRTYAGFVAHLGFLCLAVGVTGSSLGTERREFDMDEGQTVRWVNRSIQFARLERVDQADKLVVEAKLMISPDRAEAYTLRPAQHFHKLQKSWTTEAAIHAVWSGDFYTILHHGEGTHAHFTFVFNPLMKWIWFGGWVIGSSVLVGIWPGRLVATKMRQADSTFVSEPNGMKVHRAGSFRRLQRSVKARG